MQIFAGDNRRGSGWISNVMADSEISSALILAGIIKGDKKENVILKNCLKG